MQRSLLLITIGCLLLLATQCPMRDSLPPSGLAGETLAKQHCAACHQFPEPGLLDYPTWKNEVLPKMGYLMGFRDVHAAMKHHFTEGELGTQLLDSARRFSTHPIMALEDWEKIHAYYLSAAPPEMPRDERPEITIGLDHFSVELPRQRYSPPGTAMVRFMADGKIMVGDIHKKILLQYDRELNLLKSAAVGTGAVHLEELPEDRWLTVMGNFLASDQPTGYLIRYPKNPDVAAGRPISGLKRPVHAAYGDLNGDGRPDPVISEFGKWMGQLAWWEAKEDGYTPHVLAQAAAPVRADVQDMNGDGRADVVALFGQDREGIRIFYNQPTGVFTEEEVLSFHPAMGSSYFELKDMDRDGDLDILYTAGDNADYRPIPKPYHGIYLFLNDGNAQFTPGFFYPLYGAYGVRAEDFDLDGDLDLAAISFFPDYKDRPEASFLYLRNDGDFHFSPSTFERSFRGRWICMDTADYDQDGDIDIVLGSLALEISEKELQHFQETWVREGLHFLVLNNQSR